MKKSAYTHIIWDWNGTIVDDADLCLESLNTLLTQRKLPVLTQKEYAHRFGFPVRTFYEDHGFDFKHECYNAVADEFIEYYHARRFKCDLRSGVSSMFTFFEDAGIEQSIVSAYRQDSLQEAVEHYGLESFFKQVDGLGTNQAGSKVDLGVKRMRELDCNPDDVLYIGDTNHDAEVAEAMGVRCILLEGGHQNRERLCATGAQVLKTAKEISNYVR